MNKRPFQDEFKYMYGVSDRPILFLFGLLIAGIAGNLAYELAHDWSQWKTLWNAWGIEFVAIGVLFAAVLFFNRRYYERKLKKERERQIHDWLRPEKEKGMNFSYRGIIWLLSPDKNSLPIARYGIGQHKMKGKLEVCWCIYGSEDRDVKEELMERMRELKEQLEDFGVNIPIEEYPIAKPDAQYTFDAVNDIYQNKIKNYGLAPYEVVADITGGFASMSAGMAIACRSLEIPIEYIQVPYLRDSSGNMVRSTQVGTWKHVLIDPRENISTTKGDTS